MLSYQFPLELSFIASFFLFTHLWDVPFTLLGYSSFLLNVDVHCSRHEFEPVSLHKTRILIPDTSLVK